MTKLARPLHSVFTVLCLLLILVSGPSLAPDPCVAVSPNACIALQWWRGILILSWYVYLKGLGHKKHFKVSQF